MVDDKFLLNRLSTFPVIHFFPLDKKLLATNAEEISNLNQNFSDLGWKIFKISQKYPKHLNLLAEWADDFASLSHKDLGYKERQALLRVKRWGII